MMAFLAGEPTLIVAQYHNVAVPALLTGSSVLWMYHSHFVESMADINTGLTRPDYRDMKRERKT